MISRYLKGISNGHPPLPKYTQIWDINQVLDYYTNLLDNKELEFKYIVKKLVMLFFILGAGKAPHEKINRCLTNINRCLTNIFKI